MKAYERVIYLCTDPTQQKGKKLQNRPKFRSLTGPMAYHNYEAAQPIYQSYAENFGIV